VTTLADALRRRFRSPAEVMDALGLDRSLLKDGSNMAYQHHQPARGRDAEPDDRDRKRECRDAIRRACDAAEFDPGDVMEALAEYYPVECGTVVREMGEDRSPRRWARDRRERRAADRHLASRPREFGRDDPASFYGMPETGGGMYREDKRPIENFVERRGESRREETSAADRGRAHDIAMDSGARSFAHLILGEQGMAIERR
jgi:hypothetical protein